uniref:tetratricopeptide repeat protein n=1 Tax=Treponema zioleckii TaxID=331680 RepID=UPI0018DA2291
MKKFFVLLLFFIAGFCYGNEADDIDELMVLFNEGNEEAILTKAEKILSVESCSNDAKYNVFSILNEFYYRKRDYILAWENAMKMIDCDPYNGYGYFRAGDILLILHNQVEACEYLSKAIELDPTQPNYHLARGMAKYELFKRKFITNKKNIEKNELYYDELLKIFDDFAEEMILDTEDYYPIYMGGLLLAFYIDENLPDYKELIQNGISLLNKAIRLNPNFINSYFVLASVYGSQKCYDIEKCYQN